MSMVCKAWHAAAAGEHAGQWWASPELSGRSSFFTNWDDPERTGSFLGWLTQPPKRLTFTHVGLDIRVQPADLLLEACAAAMPLMLCLTLASTAQCSDTALAMLPRLAVASLSNVELMTFRWAESQAGAGCLSGL